MRVIVEHTFTVVEEWPEEYATKEHIEFVHNDGTSCANNIVEKLYKTTIEDKSDCYCRSHKARVVKIGDKEVEPLQLN